MPSVQVVDPPVVPAIDELPVIVAVKPSPAYGGVNSVGVFVTCDLPSPAFLCVYGGEKVTIAELVDRRVGNEYVLSCDDGQHAIIGDKTRRSGHYVAQLINDASKPRLRVTMSLSQMKDALDQYRQESKQGSNAAYLHQFGEGVVGSTRDLSAGEELLISYGSDYWVQRLLFYEGDVDGNMPSSSMHRLRLSQLRLEPIVNTIQISEEYARHVLYLIEDEPPAREAHLSGYARLLALLIRIEHEG